MTTATIAISKREHALRIMNRRPVLYGLIALSLVWIFAMNWPGTIFEQYHTNTHHEPHDFDPDASESPLVRLAGQSTIGDHVAVITDTQYSERLVPLIMHFHAMLGPDWPIIFYTSQDNFDEHFGPNAEVRSAVWDRAVAAGSIEVRLIGSQFDLTQREGVNIFLSKPWLWNQLAPAKNVLIFQTDAMICANSPHKIEDFLKWDFIGAPFRRNDKIYNGGLSLRNRDSILDLLEEGRDWQKESEAGEWKEGGEDVWFGRMFEKQRRPLPSTKVALQFSHEYNWNVREYKQPFGYHKVHKNAKDSLAEIRKWCPEIELAAPGQLKG